MKARCSHDMKARCSHDVKARCSHGMKARCSHDVKARGPLKRWLRDKRAAAALIIAVSFLPLFMLTGLAIDYSFYTQARTQLATTAESSATYAVRTAAATYAIELSHNASTAVATAHAITAGQDAGELWFQGQVGAMVRGSVSSALGPGTAQVVVTYSGGAGSTAPGFDAAVSYTGGYPPIFGGVFHSTNTWTFSNAVNATTQYTYSEILLMLDTSNSMLIGATSSDITTMDENSVCLKTGYVASNTGINPLVFPGLGTVYAYQPGDGDQVDFTKVANYNDPSGTASDTSGTCAAGYQATNITVSGQEYSGEPLAPCALACHTTTAKAADGYYADLYGNARRLGVTLREDVVFSATEQVINDMISATQIAGHMSVGVYQFNADVAPIAVGANGDPLPEATTNLQNALSAVQADDYFKTPSETAIPVLVGASYTGVTTQESADGNTNLVLAVSDLLKGNASGGTAIAASGDGVTAATPKKFIFLVTDGLEDSGPGNNGGVNGQHVMGEMTGIMAEGGGTGVCSQLKSLGFTVYVLYVPYTPVPHLIFYNAGFDPQTDPYTNADYPAVSNGDYQQVVEGTGATNGVAPDTAALKACASSTNDFFEADQASQITTAMQQMMTQAMPSTTRVTP